MPSSLFPAAAFIYNLCKRPSSALHIYMGPEEKNEGEETASCDIASRLVLVTRKMTSSWGSHPGLAGLGTVL